MPPATFVGVSPNDGRAVTAPLELELVAGAAANGGSCVARHEGRVVFVRYALPGERVRARVTAEKGSYWHAEAFEVLDPSPDRVPSMCPIAGVAGAGCCDFAFVDRAAGLAIKGQVVANQLARLGDYRWEGVAEPVGAGESRGWRTRVRLGTDAEGRAGFHRYHSADLVTDLRCAQLPDGMLAGVEHRRWTSGEQVYVALDDDGGRHVGVKSADRRGMVTVEGSGEVLQRVGTREWRLPVDAFWQSHRHAAATYSALVRQWAGDLPGARAWDLYGGAGVLAATLADAVGERGRVLTVDTSRAASAAARVALADLAAVRVMTGSVRAVLADQRRPAGIAVLDPPRAGAGKAVVDLIASAGTPRVIHIGCEAAAFARDVGLYRSRGYRVEQIRVFDAFPLTHHVECAALLIR